MSIEEAIIGKLTTNLGEATQVQVDIEGADCGRKALIIVTSPVFEGTPRIARHRRIHECLGDEIMGTLHAVSIKAATPKELLQN